MKTARAFLEMIKFEHTVFALPFAYLGMALAARGWPTWPQFLWITLAMASARTLGMSANRVFDREIDGLNPRTADRPLLTGQISIRTAWTGMALSAAILGLAAYMLNPLTFRLLPGALVCLLGYPFTKRFTWLSHFALGFTDGLAPMGAWAGVRGSLFTAQDLPAWLLLFIVIVWMAGFDIIYACQDVEVDRREGLHSAPARFGIARALALSRVCHALTVAGLAVLGLGLGLGIWYWLGVAVTAGLLVHEHTLVSPTDLSKVNVAFFNVNGYISVTLFASTLAALLLR